MTDAINNNVANTLRAAEKTTEANSKARLDAAEAQSPESAAKVEPSTVEVSPALQSALADADFDTEKVEAIKTAIEQGNYPLDDSKIAESFVPLEKLL